MMAAIGSQVGAVLKSATRAKDALRDARETLAGVEDRVSRASCPPPYR